MNTIFILESMESARRRNAKVYAEIAGFGTTSEAYSMYKMDETGREAARSMAMAFKGGDVELKEVNYINRK